MDRTIITPYRAEERELSQLLFNKLQGLIMLHAPSEELKKCLSEEMFVKPNQHAFFHVMHYLFRLIDPNEFKKRFYWPITDKRAESNFRSSTVEYLKHLNEKHQLNWTNIKSYLVVMPGGMKFISFLLDFVHFIIQELIKQKEKQLGCDSSQDRELVTDEQLEKMIKRDTFFKEFASGYLDQIDIIIKRYTEKEQLLMQRLDEMSSEMGLSVATLTDDKFLMDFGADNTKLYAKNYVERRQQILEIEKQITSLKDSMDKFKVKECGYKCDKQKIRRQLKNIGDNFSIDNLSNASFGVDDININTLITTFNCISETIQNELEAATSRPRDGIVQTRLLDVQKDLKEIEAQITEFLMVIKLRMKNKPEDILHTPQRHNVYSNAAGANQIKRNMETTLLMKYVATPPIKLEMSEVQHGPSRLSLFDSKTTGNASTFSSFLAPQRPTRHHRLNSSIADQSMQDLNNTTVNRSKLIDPMQLLRSITKDSSKIISVTPKSNLSSLGGKWKERQSLFMDKENECPATPTITVTSPDSPQTGVKKSSALHASPYKPHSDKEADISSTSTITKRSFATSSGSPTIIQSPFTPFSSNERTRIARSQFSYTGGNSPSTSWSCIKKRSAVKKVQDASKMFANLSTSPSGRLEPLVTAEDFNIPVLKLNDMSFNNSVVDKSSIRMDDSMESHENIADFENTSITKISENYKAQIEEEDALFNISDSVLKDVTL